ncbi:hypothetical protein [Lysobacter sp. TY2-98]|uniref:hypothetical protein n=1 Tax=Lysobacter sp. TY2-98 TaxID=2290922 RepID=UPI0013B3F52B|nr:hypothetical protein [Lysobacter sp. TY2-98]
MEAQVERPPATPNGPFTVLVSTLLTLAGIFGVAVGVGELGFHPLEWHASAPRAVPILVSAVVDLWAGTALGFGHYRRAFRILLLALACRMVWSVLAHWGWLDTGRGTLELVALLPASWLQRNSRPGPNNSSKPTPLRGAA